MSVKLNSSGMPQGTGSLQLRGRVLWAVYRDEAGRKIQANTGTAELTAARRVLAHAAIAVQRARLAALRAVLDGPGQQKNLRSAVETGIAAGRNRSGAVPARRGGAAGKGGTK
jgi:hypothetical protein